MNNRTPDLLIIDESDFVDLHPFAAWSEDKEQEDHPNEYYCGTCGAWIPITEYRAHTH